MFKTDVKLNRIKLQIVKNIDKNLFRILFIFEAFFELGRYK